MRALILSDIHSNLEALSKVVVDASDRGGFDVIWCLGDVVGYGPDPRDCVQLIRRYDFLGVAGNHDFAAVGKRGDDDFNYAAKAAIQWTTLQLSEEETDFPRQSTSRSQRRAIYHGPRQPPGSRGRIPSRARCRVGYSKATANTILPGGPFPLAVYLPREPGLTSFLPVYRGRGFFLGPRASNNQPGLRGSTP